MALTRPCPVQEANIRAVNQLLRQAGGVVKIEDVLPLFPDFVQIDAFKDAICQSLEDYNAQVPLVHLFVWGCFQERWCTFPWCACSQDMGRARTCTAEGPVAFGSQHMADS